MSAPRTHDFDLMSLLAGPFYCTGCAERLCSGLAALPGVVSTGCDFEAGTLTVTHDPKILGPHDLESTVSRLAHEVSDQVGHATYRITGLD